MRKKPTLQEILPWPNEELETLLQGLIAHGTEAAKVDFKSELEANTPEQKAELLKDISAIANTYDENYGDHGFVIYGVKGKAIVGISKTEADTDKLQNHVEQLLKNYISPMPQIYVVSFETATGQKWGAIVIPPRNNKPHMFFKDMQCRDPRYTTTRGEWFVRRGSTTDPGLPEDLAIITQKQTELLLEPLRESIRNLQSRVGKTEEQYNSALFKLVERAVSPAVSVSPKEKEEREELSADIGEAIGMDLPARLKQRLRSPKDALAVDLLAEAKAVRDYLDGPVTLPWAPQLNNAAESKRIIEEIEEKTRPLALSVATIVLNDTKDSYTPALLRSIKMLAKTTDVPSGTSYNRIGEALRYYPLALVLYTIFICAVAVDRGALLKQVLEIPLNHRNRKVTSHITDIFFYWYQAKALFNDAIGPQRKCEPITERIRQFIRDNIGEMITEFPEAEYFFRGEFVLALAHIDSSISQGAAAEDRVPGPGLYLYMHEGNEPIVGLLLEHPDWLDHLYSHPLNEILDAFDRNAHKMADSGCIAIGVHGLKTLEHYEESLRRKAKK